MAANGRLNAREELFVEAYLATFNATEACKRAGYSEKTAGQMAAKLMARPHIKKALEQRKQQISKKFKVSAERVLEEMSIIGFSDITHYAIDPGGHVTLQPNAPASAIRAVKKLKRKVTTLAGAVLETTTEIELWSKDSQLRNLGDYLKLFGKDAKPIDDDDQLTPEQLEERILNILKVAAKRKAAATGGKKKAG